MANSKPTQTQMQQQKMKLALTPAVLQSLQLLQLSASELSHYMQEQALANPALELTSPAPAIHRQSPSPYNAITPSSAEESLESFLLQQLRLADLPPKVLQTAQYIAGSLDEQGYLPLPLDTISDSMSQPIAIAETALKALQALDPAGVGARSIQECLLLQVARRSDAPVGTAEAIASHGLELIARGKLKLLAKQMHIGLKQVEAITSYIRTQLNPRPGLAYQPKDPSTYVVPDAYLHVSANGVEITLNRQLLPQLTVNANFLAVSAKEDSDPLLDAYLKERMQAARILIAGLEQRTATLLRVIGALAEAQLEFLKQGPLALQPLQLKEVAEKLQLHPSTISRAIRHKYVRTPQGLFALKYFFSKSLPIREAEGISDSPKSARHAMERIRSWITSENKCKPYSDLKLAELLKTEGIPISRRTVAKYREGLHIPASPFRRARFS